MDINFKVILSKLSVFKNNLSLLISVIVALIAISLLLPTHLLSAKLGSRIQSESLSQWRKIESYRRDPIEPVTPESLEQDLAARTADANAVIAMAERTTMRELLSYDIFPQPDPKKGVSGLTFVDFGRRYRAGIEEMIRNVNGGASPTDVEIKNRLEDSAARMNRRPGMGFGMGGDPGDLYSTPMMAPHRRSGMPGMFGARSEIDTMIIDQLCEDRARNLSVYVNPIDIAGYEYWVDYKFDPNMTTAVKDAWYHQLSYWVIEDIFDTIRKMNAGHNILSAPVKRFMRISFSMGLKRPGSRRSSTAVIRSIGGRKTSQQERVESDRPYYVIEDRDGLTESLTARYSTQDSPVDVIHFNVAVVVANKDVLAFLQELCAGKEHKFRGYPDGTGPLQNFKHNQITVLEMKSGAVNNYDPLHRYNRYGDESVVELDLICEYIFHKTGYEPIKPQVVKDALAGAESGV